MTLPKPHFEKLNALLENENLPTEDVPRIETAIEKYEEWVGKLKGVSPGETEKVVTEMVDLLNEYKLYIELDLIFDSPRDFLYRQKGQLKLDNTIIEEFLPHLIVKAISELNETLDVGPLCCFSSAYFTSSLRNMEIGGGLHIRTKNQDFAIARKLFLKASHDEDFENSVTQDAYLGYVVAECKTNLDKTMFQEASATAHDVKTAVPGSKYYLLCEWLDMTPISTAPTDIDEVLILRQGKRISSNVRSKYSTVEGRRSSREQLKTFLTEYPFSVDVFNRLVAHITGIIGDHDPTEEDVLEKGFF